MLCRNYLKSYCMFGRDKTGRLFGYIEQSFSMGLSTNQVRRWPVLPYGMKLNQKLSRYDHVKIKEAQDKLLEMLERDVQRMKVLHPEMDFFIVRMNSKNCPVIFDWKKYKTAKGKYDMRNIFWSAK